MYRYTPGLELAGYQIGGADFFVGQFGMGMYIAAYGSDFGFPSDDGFGQLHGCSPILFVEWNFTPVSAYHQILAWNRNIVWSSLFRSEEHTSELQSLMRISYAVFCLKKKKNKKIQHNSNKQYKKY